MRALMVSEKLWEIKENVVSVFLFQMLSFDLLNFLFPNLIS